MDSTVAALLGAIIGGALSVLASWLAQRVQTKSQWLSQEISRRQKLYSEFIAAAARCYADALQSDELSSGRLSKLYAEIGQMRLHSSEEVVRAAYNVAHKIIATSAEVNRSKGEVREMLSRDSIDLFSLFGDACRAELMQLQPHRIVRYAPLDFRPVPIADPAE